MRNYPWYKGWHDAFSQHGLTVIGIHTPEGSQEHDPDNVQRHASKDGLAFPILIDNGKQNWDRWGNSMWPTTYLIDKQGYVRYWWRGELNWKGNEGEKVMRQRIEELLAESVQSERI